MCSRNRSRPSSNRRLTKNVKRLSSGRSARGSAMGVLDEHRLITNGPASAAGPTDDGAPVSGSGARFSAGVMSLGRSGRDAPAGGASHGDGGSFRCACGTIVAAPPSWECPEDRWLCVPVFRRVCPLHRLQFRGMAPASQAFRCGLFLSPYLPQSPVYITQRRATARRCLCRLRAAICHAGCNQAGSGRIPGRSRPCSRAQAIASG